MSIILDKNGSLQIADMYLKKYKCTFFQRDSTILLLQLQLKVFEESSEDFYNATSCVNKNSKKEARSKKLPLVVVQQEEIHPKQKIQDSVFTF